MRAILIAVLFAGCTGGSTSGGASDGGDVIDGAGTKAPSIDGKVADETGALEGGVTIASACDHYFVAQYEGPCQVPPIAPSDLARIRPRFDAWCESDRGRPGLSAPAERLDACASTLATQNCTDPVPPDCVIGAVGGTLQNGQPCNGRDQCQSGVCMAVASDAAQSLCGVCKETIVAGQPCDPKGDSVCSGDAFCVSNDAGTSTCQMRTMSDVDASCATSATRCKEGLFCDATKVCKAPGDVGASCSTTAQCRAPLACTNSAGGTCQNRGGVGASCAANPDSCAFGLGCSGGRCTTLKWAQPGEPCDMVTPCFVGDCPYAGPNLQGICPATVIADRQPCKASDRTTTCDNLAGCINGMCTLIATTCR